jgi:Mg2+/Co2+ transporter CorC
LLPQFRGLTFHTSILSNIDFLGGVVGQQIAAVPVRCVVVSVHNNNAHAAVASSRPRRCLAAFPPLRVNSPC